MKQTIIEQATHSITDWVFLVLAGLGVSIAVDQYFGGMLLSLASASIVARHRNDVRKKWVIAGTAALVATLVAMIWPSTGFHLPVQFAMALSGFASKPIVSFTSKFMDRVEERADDITDKIVDKVLPNDDQED